MNKMKVIPALEQLGAWGVGRKKVVIVNILA